MGELKLIGMLRIENACCPDEPVEVWDNGNGSYACECHCHMYNTQAQKKVSDAIAAWEEICGYYRNK